MVDPISKPVACRILVHRWHFGPEWRTIRWGCERGRPERRAREYSSEEEARRYLRRAGKRVGVRRFAFVIVLLAGLATGCGEPPSAAGPEERLPAVLQAEVTEARERIRALCREGPPRPEDLRPAVADLVAVLERYPDRIVQGGEFDRTRTVPDAALLAADDLEDCGAEEIAEEVREAVARVS